MNLSEITTEVQDLVADNSVATAALIKQTINDVRGWLACEFHMPRLKTYGAVSTQEDLAWTHMPSDFDDGPLTVMYNRNPLVQIEGGLDVMLQKWGALDFTGTPCDYAVEDNVLWYQPIPSDVVVLPLVYYRMIVDLDANTDVPDEVPKWLHYDIFVHACAARAYVKLEDAMEGPRANSRDMMELFTQGINKLSKRLERKKTHRAYNTWSPENG